MFYLKLKKTPIITTILFIVAITVLAEVRSGFWTHIDPSGTLSEYQVDFSMLTPLCSFPTTTSQCSVDVADCTFELAAIHAPRGIYYDSATNAQLQSLVTGKAISANRDAHFYLDSMLKKIELTAPTVEYVDSIPIRSGAFFIKTDEGHCAVMIVVNEYIGGINRTTYYYAYQTDGSTTLSKNRIYELPGTSLNITVDAFSGRPNPVFLLSDSAACAAIIHKAYVSVNTLLDSSVKIDTVVDSSALLGYRGLSMYGMFLPENPLSSYMPTMNVGKGYISYYNNAPEFSPRPLWYFIDINSELEKLIIYYCCRANLVSTAETDPVTFCELIPDSLKSVARNSGGTLLRKSEKLFHLEKVGRGRVRIKMELTGLLKVDLYNINGQRVAAIESPRFEAGNVTLDFHRLGISSGVYFIRCCFSSMQLKNVTFSLVVP